MVLTQLRTVTIATIKATHDPWGFLVNPISSVVPTVADWLRSYVQGNRPHHRGTF